MLLFCPLCSNMLTVSPVPNEDPAMVDASGRNRFECRTCPYQYILNKRYFERKTLKTKQAEDILGGEGAWANVDKTKVNCPISNCGNGEAYFYMLQIRSADEPMTAFYKCTACGKQWRE